MSPITYIHNQIKEVKRLRARKLGQQGYLTPLQADFYYHWIDDLQAMLRGR